MVIALSAYSTGENPVTAYWKTLLFDFDHPLVKTPDGLETEFHAWQEMLRPDPAAIRVILTIVRLMKI